MRAEKAGDEKWQVGPYLVDNEQVIRQPAGEQESLLMMVNGVSRGGWGGRRTGRSEIISLQLHTVH